ncbi:hypothetical protein EG328_000996 [Venturia inaequalis]|uniref:rhamnogalacturonan endolyase n=1 Tax=Venturia inaequalis TaxID=5025 RepID=A0A8H3V135_VENIN|nr:hypothetical protein EG328_000996 [Venturia inaequalis]KAE9993024.1 hypothetical protein EG327_006806 [Venturia inaequalis]
MRFLPLLFLSVASIATAGEPFLKEVNKETHIIGNDIWNVTIGAKYGTKLFYKGVNLVGKAAGHYVTYSVPAGVQTISWNYSAPYIFSKTPEYTDIVFSAPQGDLHWVISRTLAGAYQYFVNRALSAEAVEFRTLWRLANNTFTHAHTSERDEAFPALSDYSAPGVTKVQDETWQRPDGTYLTKYDFSTFLTNVEGDLTFWGVRGRLGGNGRGIGSWYIHGGKDYLNGDHLKQELQLHRESKTGDAVQLNMIHGSHFQASSNDSFPVGKIWGPWLWYLNDGSPEDAAARAKAENAAWPYAWLKANSSYHLRGSISGCIALSDGRPASNAAVFLGDNYPTRTTLDQGSNNYYRTYANADGCFSISNVREGTWNLQIWPNGGSIGDVTTVFSQNDVTTKANTVTDLGILTWATQGRKPIWQIGEIDRKATGFAQSGPPHKHAMIDNCPANLTYTVGQSVTKDWCFAQGAVGTWTVLFDVATANTANPTLPAAILSVSLAAYSATAEKISSFRVSLNGVSLGGLVPANTTKDPAVYRSGTLAGEWRYFEIPVQAGLVKVTGNKLEITVKKRASRWSGIMWDSLLMEFV